MKTIIINNKKIKLDAIIFDKDGTLIEIYPMLWAIAKKRLEKLTGLTSAKIIKPYYAGIGADPKAKKISPYGPLASAPRTEEIIVCAGILFNCGYPYFEAKKIAKAAYDAADAEMNLKEGLMMIGGVKELLFKLWKKKIKIFIVTSDSNERARRMLKILNISKYITEIIGSDACKAVKPAPDAVLHILKKHKLKPDNTAVCGDSIIDMQMGIAAGIKYNIGVLTGTSAKKELKKYTDLILNSIADISVEY